MASGWGNAFTGLSNDIFRFLDVRNAERARREQLAREDARYKDELARYEAQTRRQEELDKQAMLDREFGRASQIRSQLGPGETQNPEVGNLLQKHGFAQQIDQAANNETEGTVNQTNPNRYSIPATFLEQGQMQDQAWQLKQQARQENDWRIRDTELSNRNKFMAGLPPEQRQRAEAQMFVPGFDPSEPSFAEKQKIEHGYRMSEINAQQPNRDFQQTVQALSLTKPDPDADPVNFASWRSNAERLLQKYINGGQQPMMGPEPVGGGDMDLGALPAVTQSPSQPGFFSNAIQGPGIPTPGSMVGNMGSMIEQFLQKNKPGGTNPYNPQPMELPNEGSFPQIDPDLEEIMRNLDPRRPMSNPRDPSFHRYNRR